MRDTKDGSTRGPGQMPSVGFADELIRGNEVETVGNGSVKQPVDIDIHTQRVKHFHISEVPIVGFC